MENNEEKIQEIKKEKEKEKSFIDRVLGYTDEDIAKMTYKEKQQYYKDKRKIVNVVYRHDPKGPKKPYVKEVA